MTLKRGDVVNFGLCRPCAIGTGERRNKTCQSLINLVSSCVLKLDNASKKRDGERKSKNKKSVLCPS